MMNAVGDAGTIARLKARDLEALEVLIPRYQHRLYRYLLRLVRNTSEAEDLFQQTWLRVVDRIGRYDASRSFDTWLFSVAHNLAIDHLRRVRGESLGEEEDGRDHPPPSPDQGALAALLDAERRAAVAAAVARLPAAYREVLTLRFEEEMSLQDLGDAVNVPLPTAKTRLRRALIALRNELGAEPPDRSQHAGRP